MTTPAFPALRVTILRHSRCKHCRLLHQVGKDYVCDAGIGGTAVVWATGRRAFRRRRPAGWPDITGILPGGRFGVQGQGRAAAAGTEGHAAGNRKTRRHLCASPRCRGRGKEIDER